MSIPGFTAEAGIGATTTNYSAAAAHAVSAGSGHLHPALIAMPLCRTSSCLTIGRCKTKVRCCRSFNGTCSCNTVPCFFLGPPESI